MVEIYVKTNTNYTDNGDITLTPTSCTFKNSEQELTLTHFIDDEGRWKYLEVDNVIAIGFRGKKLRYRIHNVIKSLFLVTVYARPIFLNDAIDTVILDKALTNVTGQEALDQILEGTGFIGHSDITTVNSFQITRKNVVEALFSDDETSFINIFGGEFHFENNEIWINNTIGSDNGVRVEFGYNLNEIEQEIDISEVVTRIIPIGYDGIMLEGNAPWITSLDNVNKYPHPKTRVIEFSDVKVKSDPNNPNEEGFNTIEEARQELIKRSQELFTVGKIDQPKVNYKIDMINLSNTTYYKDFKDLLTVNKGDTVTCYIPHLDINVKARVIDFERDMLTGEYISIELGNVLNNYLKNQVDIQHRVNNITNDNGTVKADVLEGEINALQTRFRALKDVAQPQDIYAMLFEDRVQGSPTFGSLAIGTMGFMIADSFHPGTTNWNYRTFGTGKGFTADYITAGTMSANRVRTGLIESVDKKTWINLNDGSFSFQDKFKFDSATNQATFDFSNTNQSNLATKTDVDNAKNEVNGNINTAKNEVNNNINTTRDQLRSEYQNAVVTVDGTGVDIKNGALTVSDNQGRVVLQGDANGDLTFTGKLQPNDYQLRLFGNDCKIDGSANAIRLQYNPQIYTSVDRNGAFRFFNQNSNGGTRYTSIFMDTNGHTQFYNNTTMLKLLGGVTPEVQARNSGDNAYTAFAGSQFRNMSSRKYKTNIENPSVDFIKVLKENNIKKYQLKDDNSGDKLGFILEELSDEAKNYLNPNGTESIDIYAMCSMLWGIVQEQQKQIEELQMKGGI